MSRPAGRVLIVDDEEGVRGLLSCLALQEGFASLTATDGKTALDLIRRESPDVVLLKIDMPGLDGLEFLRRTRELDSDLPIIMITAHGFVQGAVDAIRGGAHDYLVKPFEQAEVIRAVHRAMNDRRLRRTVRFLSDRAREGVPLPDLMGPSDHVARISADVARVASSDFTVLITGETGSGKELVALAIHEASRRASGPFVAVDCGAIPESLFESEVFGHERGAFTGAERQKPGKLESAAGGSLFLDEIANMPAGCQAKLLRALQDNRVVRVGGTRAVRVDIRLLVATNRDLGTAVAAGFFRQDLFFRLNEFAITIPPLRERKQDIIFLAKRFLDLTNHELRKAVRRFSGAAVERLLAHDWPGNVRELRSAVRRAVLLADEEIEEEHLGLPRMPSPLAGLPRVSGVRTGGLALKEVVRRATVAVERSVLMQVLRETGGNKAKAARLLQIDYKTIHTKLKDYGIATHGGESDGQEEEHRPAR